jgi:leader peptidase (prepilin peptidase)/N-methyltransferase
VTIVTAFAAGVLYAGILWSIAALVARRRALTLGALPHWLFIACGSVAAVLSAFLPVPAALLAGTSLVGALVCALVDARTGFIFDALSLTMIAVAGSIAAGSGRLTDGAMAVALVGSVLVAVYLCSGRRGIGLGDVKLGCAIALGFGVQAALITIGSAFVLGAAYAIVLIATGRAKRSDSIRFGPFIAGGAAVGLTAGAVSWPW